MRRWGLMRACSSCPHALGHDLLAAGLETETRFASLQLQVWVETLRGGLDSDGVCSNLNCSLAARPTLLQQSNKRRNRIHIESEGGIWIALISERRFYVFWKTKIWFVVTRPHRIGCCYVIVASRLARSITHTYTRSSACSAGWTQHLFYFFCPKNQMNTQCHHEQNFSVPPASTGSIRVFLSHTHAFFLVRPQGCPFLDRAVFLRLCLVRADVSGRARC